MLSQTFTDFELIVVDDGCTDRSIELVNGFNDSRIRILRNEKNSGIVFSRNRGLESAQGRYVAQFDADDIALPEKFQKQVRFLEENPQFGMIGSWAILIDDHGRATGKKWKVNAAPERIPSILLFMNYFVQSAVVARKEAMPNGFYSPGFDIVEDYKMWFEISRNSKVWNYPEYLVKYRVHSKSSSTRSENSVRLLEMKVFRHIYETCGISMSDDQLETLWLLKSGTEISLKSHLEQIEELLYHIHCQNRKAGAVNDHELRKVIQNRWLKACIKTKGNLLQKVYAIARTPWLIA